MLHYMQIGNFSQNLLISNTFNSSIQLVQIVSTERRAEVLSVADDRLIFSQMRDYNIQCKTFWLVCTCEKLSIWGRQ